MLRYLTLTYQPTLALRRNRTAPWLLYEEACAF